MARILVVDDEPDVAGVVEKMVTQCGHTVLHTSNGMEALILLKEVPVDLMITDIIMPHMTGVRLVDEVRKLYPHIKIIALSGGGPQYNAETCVELARQHGADDAILKPPTLETIRAKLQRNLALATRPDPRK